MCLKESLKPSHNRLYIMSVSFTIFISLTFLIICGCTGQKQPDEAKPPTNKVVIPIKKGPVRKASIPPSEEKEGDQLNDKSPTEPVMATQDKGPPEPEEQASEEIGLPDEDKGEEQATGIERMKAETAAQAQETPTLSSSQEQSEAGRAVKMTGNYYKVVKGDNLLEIAGRKEIYGDPYKWTSLFRHNMDKLGSMTFTEDYTTKALLEGIELKYITPDEAAENLNKMERHLWVVNALSFQDPNKLVMPAVKLMTMGYHVYITSARVKGKDWMRLRVGFFQNRSEAVAARDKVCPVVDAEDVWITKAKESEFEEYAGY